MNSVHQKTAKRTPETPREKVTAIVAEGRQHLAALITAFTLIDGDEHCVLDHAELRIDFSERAANLAIALDAIEIEVGNDGSPTSADVPIPLRPVADAARADVSAPLPKPSDVLRNTNRIHRAVSIVKLVQTALDEVAEHRGSAVSMVDVASGVSMLLDELEELEIDVQTLEYAFDASKRKAVSL